MKFLVKIPVYYYGGDPCTRNLPPFVIHEAKDIKDARKIKQRVDRAYKFISKDHVNINSGSKWRFVELIDELYGTQSFGKIDGNAIILKQELTVVE